MPQRHIIVVVAQTWFCCKYFLILLRYFYTEFDNRAIFVQLIFESNNSNVCEIYEQSISCGYMDEDVWAKN